MAEDSESHVSNEIAERPVDVFYGGMTQIISLSFKDIPVTNCVNNKSWEIFLRNAWDKYFPEIDNILDFLRYCVYHTGMVGRFYKMNQVLSLDDVISLLKDRLPDSDASFKVWHKLHKIASLILKEKCEIYASNVTLVLDLHISTNSICDNSEDMIKFLNFEALPSEEERMLIYHITICYDVNDKSTSAGCADLSNLKSLPNDKCIDFDDKSEVLEVSKPTTSLNQYDSLTKIRTDLNDADPWTKYGARPKNKLYSLKNCSDKENGLLRKECSISSQLHMAKLKEFDAFVDAKVKSCCANDMSPVSRPFAAIPPSPRKSDARTEVEQCCGKCCDISGSEHEFKPAKLLKRTDVELKESSGHAEYIPARISPNVQSEKKSVARKKFNVFDVLSNGRKSRRILQKAYDALFSFYTSPGTGCELPNPDDRSKKMDQRSIHKTTSGVQENDALQLPFLSFPSLESEAAANLMKNSSFDMNIHEHHPQVRESILRHEIKTFFENYKSSDACLDDVPSVTTINNNPAIEPYSDFHLTDVQFRSVPTIDSKNSSVEMTDVTCQTELSHEDRNSGHLAIKNFDDKVSFNWEHLLTTETSIIRNSNPVTLQEIPAEKVEELPKDNGTLFLDGEPLETSEEFYDIFFQDIIQQLANERPFFPKGSPERCESPQSAPYKKHSTPEKTSELIYLEKTDDEIKSLESSVGKMFSANEKFSGYSDESLNLSGFDNSPDYESASDFE